MQYIRTLFLLFLLLLPVSAQTPVCWVVDNTDRPLVIGDRVLTGGGMEGLSPLVMGTVIKIEDGWAFVEPDKQCREMAILRSKDSYMQGPPVEIRPEDNNPLCLTEPSTSATLCRRSPVAFEVIDKGAYRLLKQRD